MPWFVLLFAGAFDWGFYAHALISTESAARVATLATSASAATAGNQSLACKYAYEELKIASNITQSTDCTALPLIVTATATKGSPDNEDASEVTVTYQTQQLIAIPGLLSGRPTFYRRVLMRLRG